MIKDNYNHLNQFLKDKFGERTLKICIDAGFTCPNRDGSKSYGGCIYCSNRGSGDHLKQIAIKEQIENFLNSYKKDRANKFIAYFQNFTNTYGPIKELKEKYDQILKYKQIVALAVATRPDCITKEVVELLSSYKDKYYVWVELGLQTANEKTSKLINKCYTNDDFTKAVELLNQNDIDVVTHIMVGLPNETKEELKNTVDFVNNHKLKGIKIHSTYVLKNTALAEMYINNNYQPLTLENYIEQCIYILEHISPDLVIHRICGDANKDEILAPEFAKHKKWILNGIEKELKRLNIVQGSKFNNNN